jgi:DNA-binding transcriptional regulator GbsR (MarR family)
MFRAIAQERKKREMDPTMALLTECLAEADSSKDAVLKERLTELRGFFVTVNGWYEQIFAMPTGILKNAMKLGSALSSLLPKGKP